MKTRKPTMRAFLLVALVLSVAACGGPKATTLTPDATSKTIKQIPRWYANIPTDDNHLLAVATATSRDLQTAVNKAQHDGRSQIANQLEVKYSGLTKRFVEEVGTDSEAEFLDQFSQAYKAVVSQVVTGSRAREQEIVPEQGIYRAYVLMEMPIGRANKLLVDKIKADRAMYTRFRASKSFQDLEAEAGSLDSAAK